MKTKALYSIILASAALTPLAAADELNQTISVTKETEVVEHKAEKMEALPDAAPSTASPVKLKFSDWAVPAAVNPWLVVQNPQRQADGFEFSTKRGYAEFGIGNYMNMVGSLGYRVVDKEQMSMNIWLQHNSANGSISNYATFDPFSVGNGEALLRVDNHGLPLDTLWHGMETTPVEVFAGRPTYHTIPLVRDTKKINVTLRELDNPATMDVANYDMAIIDHNATLRWDNSVDESQAVVYTPHATWNTNDRTGATDANNDPVGGVGRMAHADFMTSRIIIHDDPADDGVLTIKNRTTGMEVVRVNLPDILSRLRNAEEIHRYSAQEFLDRGYDYQLDFYIKGDRLAYVNISISILGWSKRIQFEDL
mgnify:CR=1 FL=1